MTAPLPFALKYACLSSVYAHVCDVIQLILPLVRECHFPYIQGGNIYSVDQSELSVTVGQNSDMCVLEAFSNNVSIS